MRLARLSTLGLVVILAGCGSSGPGPAPNAGTRPPARTENDRGGPGALLLKYDANHDGTLTRDELIAGLKQEFAALDTNHDGCLTPDQVDAINQERIAADRSTATPLQDWNQDGCVDYREFSAAAYSLFDEMDRNGDGKITPDEFNPKAARPAEQYRPIPVERRRPFDQGGPAPLR